MKREAKTEKEMVKDKQMMVKKKTIQVWSITSSKEPKHTPHHGVQIDMEKWMERLALYFDYLGNMKIK